MKYQDIIPEHIQLRDINTSSKLSAILKVLYARSTRKNPTIPARRKLIFCHYREEIDALGHALNMLGITNSTIDGRTKTKSRKISLEYAPDVGEMHTVCKHRFNFFKKKRTNLSKSFKI